MPIAKKKAPMKNPILKRIGGNKAVKIGDSIVYKSGGTTLVCTLVGIKESLGTYGEPVRTLIGEVASLPVYYKQGEPEKFGLHYDPPLLTENEQKRKNRDALDAGRRKLYEFFKG